MSARHHHSPPPAGWLQARKKGRRRSQRAREEAPQVGRWVRGGTQGEARGKRAIARERGETLHHPACSTIKSTHPAGEARRCRTFSRSIVARRARKCCRPRSPPKLEVRGGNFFSPSCAVEMERGGRAASPPLRKTTTVAGIPMRSYVLRILWRRSVESSRCTPARARAGERPYSCEVSGGLRRTLLTGAARRHNQG